MTGWKIIKSVSLSLFFVFILIITSFIASTNGAAGIQIIGATVQAQQNQLALPQGAQIYIYGYSNGGGFVSNPFSYGNIATVTDSSGNIGASLALTSSNQNSFSTSDQYYTIGGVGVSGYYSYKYYTAMNQNSGANTVSLEFNVDRPAFVIIFALASSQQNVSISGLPGVRELASNPSNLEAMGIYTTSLSPGTYTVTENSVATIPGQDPNHMADLIGVFIFYSTNIPMSSSGVGSYLWIIVILVVVIVVAVVLILIFRKKLRKTPKTKNKTKIGSNIDEEKLIKLKSLLDKGLITKDDYDREVAKILKK
jgi:uncharacterized membrane protein